MPGDLRVVIYRRFMLRIAERIARDARAKALVTGDVIGQVASQTLDNIAAADSAVRMPIFRPLVGMDKEEIMAQAQRLGTFGISIVPDQDTCTLFTPRHPETHARRHQIEPVDQAGDGAPVRRSPLLPASKARNAETRRFIRKPEADAGARLVLAGARAL